jgi:DNA-binding NarL/FixJ family response regulator
MSRNIKVAILEDHQSIIDGYLFRLKDAPDIEIVGVVSDGESLENLLASEAIDVLIMDIQVPSRQGHTTPFPVLYITRRLTQDYPDLNILVISFLEQQTLIQALVELGISGYVFKQDGETIRQLANVVTIIANHGIYFSQAAYDKLRMQKSARASVPLTARQLEALSLCAAYPEYSTSEIATRMEVSNSTLRNLLSNAYLRLDVRTRGAAIARLQQMGLIATNPPIGSG